MKPAIELKSGLLTERFFRQNQKWQLWMDYDQNQNLSLSSLLSSAQKHMNVEEQSGRYRVMIGLLHRNPGQAQKAPGPEDQKQHKDHCWFGMICLLVFLLIEVDQSLSLSAMIGLMPTFICAIHDLTVLRL